MNPSSHSEATRLLAASALLPIGRTFRKQILDRIEEPCRAAAPEIGLDLEFLTQMCKFGEKRETKYNLGFTILGYIPFLILAAVLVFSSILGTAGFLSFLIVVISSLLVIILIGSLHFFKTYEENYRLLPFFVKDRYEPAVVAQRFNFSSNSKGNNDASTADVKVNEFKEDQQNLVIYNGFFPFVGAGVDLGGWSFVVDLGRPKEDDFRTKLDPIPFEVSELYAAFEQAINSLEIQGILVKDYLFANGADIRDDRLILPDIYGRPVQQIPLDIVKQHTGKSDFYMRHYKWIRIHDWKDELVFSYFLRTVVKGENLFIELSRFLLAPIADGYRQVDALKPAGWEMILGTGIISLVIAPFLPIYTNLVLLSKIPDFINNAFGLKERKRQGEIKNNPLFNYGANKSIRESLSSQKFRHYFQKLDREMYIKILDREILDTLVEFLDKHNIDTSQMQAEKTTILNNGVIVQGGNVQAQSLAVGTSAQATFLTQEPSQPRPVNRQTKQEA